MNAIALFDEPPRITFNNPAAADGSRVGLLLGIVLNGASLEGVTCLENGSVTLVNAAFFSIDFTYDVETDRFVDRNVPRPDQEG